MSCGHPHMIALPRAGNGSQTSRLADELAMAIHLGHLLPGAPLREVEIAEANNVSRTIVRAALQRLEAQGLAEIILNKGARVRETDPAAASEMIELHVQLTVLAARKAAARATPAQIAHLRQFVDMLEHVAGDEGLAEEFQYLRTGFSRALFEAAGPVLAERLGVAAPITPHHSRAMDDVRSSTGQAEAAKLSRDILKAIQANSQDGAARAAERLLRRHAELTLTPAFKPAASRKTASHA